MPAKEKHRDMVIPVKKEERFFLHNDKISIEELQRFRKNKKLNPESS